MTTDPLETLRASLARTYPDILRASVRRRDNVCTVCGRVTSGYSACFKCAREHPGSGAALADRTGFLVMAKDGGQTGQMMRTYKASPPSQENRVAVLSLMVLAWAHHRSCPALLAGVPLTGWATVPSLGGRQGDHPLRTLWSSIMSVTGGEPHEVRMRGQATARPRAVSADHFAVLDTVGPDAHVLLIDDTWVSGGHTQSAAAALHEAGAGQVSALSIARWFSADGVPSNEWIAASTVPYSPVICPWTLDGACPPRAPGQAP